MDYGRLNRKELQALCKEHGIPANKSNVFMAESLSALLKEPKESKQQSEESIPDPAEVVKARAKRSTTRTKNLSDVLAATEVEDLSSSFAKSTLSAPVPETVVDTIEEPAVPETVVDAVDAEMAEPAAEVAPSKPQRKPRTQRVKSSKTDDAEVEILPEVDLPGGFTEVPIADEAVIESVLAPGVYSRRSKKQLDSPMPASHAVEIEIAPMEESPPSSPAKVAPLRPRSRRNQNIQPESIDGMTNISSIAIEILPNPESEQKAEEGSPAAAKPVKKTKAKKGKARSKKPEANAEEEVEELSVPITEEAPMVQQSPAFVAELESKVQDEAVTAVRSNIPTAEEAAFEFEFQPVPESMDEIFSPRPAVHVEKVCTHRKSTKAGKTCKSCESETKVANVMQQVLESIQPPTLQVPGTPQAQEVEGGLAEEQSAIGANDKENSINMHSLSIRKLQKEVKKRGLSKRANAVAKV